MTTTRRPAESDRSEVGREDLGQMFLHEPAVLPGVVSSAVGYVAQQPEPGVHRGLPSPYLTFILSLDEPIVTAASERQLGTRDQRSATIIASGLHTSPAFVWMPRTQTGIQLAVHPLATRALFGATAAELDFPAVDGADLLGPGVERLRQRLLETPDWPGRFTLLDDYLRARLDTASPAATVRPEVAEAWRWLQRSAGGGPISTLSAHVQLSGRQLGTLFSREVGLSPKAVSRLVRFRTAMGAITAQIGAGRPPDLARVAVEAGYYDQSHLDRDFAGYVGLSPTRWMSEELRNIQAGGHRNGQG